MNVTWLDRNRLCGEDLAGVVAVLEAARLVDTPYQLGSTVTQVRAELTHGWDGEPPAYAVARDGDRRVVGVMACWLPGWDNTHLAAVNVTVDPLHRGRGLGRELFDCGRARASAAGRRLLVAGGFEGTPGPAFLQTMGLRRASAAGQRRLDVTAVDPHRLEALIATAQAHAAAYELLRLPGAIPDALMSDIVALTAAINDAPTDDLDVEHEVFSPERLRAFEAAQAARGYRLYRLVARHAATGTLVGHTQLAMDAERPWWGGQYDTSVLAEHRGHRLGLLLKTGMLCWLAESEPQLRTVDTWNAESNAHMLAVNDALGFRVVGRSLEFQQHL